MESAGPAHWCIQSLTQQMFMHGVGWAMGRRSHSPLGTKPPALSSFYLILSSKWVKEEGYKNKTSRERIRETKCQGLVRKLGRTMEWKPDPIRCQGIWAFLSPAGDPFLWPWHAQAWVGREALLPPPRNPLSCFWLKKGQASFSVFQS